MVKKIVTIFFLSLFLIQVLPIREVGQLISKSTMTEEMPDNCNAKATGADTKWFHIADHSLQLHVVNRQDTKSYIHYSDTLPFQHAVEITTPPPDIFC